MFLPFLCHNRLFHEAMMRITRISESPDLNSCQDSEPTHLIIIVVRNQDHPFPIRTPRPRCCNCACTARRSCSRSDRTRTSLRQVILGLCRFAQYRCGPRRTRPRSPPSTARHRRRLDRGEDLNLGFFLVVFEDRRNGSYRLFPTSRRFGRRHVFGFGRRRCSTSSRASSSSSRSRFWSRRHLRPSRSSYRSDRDVIIVRIGSQ